jgi:dTDP-4-amino-4,6-dideoxygalactose transaminase
MIETSSKRPSNRPAAGRPILPLQRPTVYGPEMKYISDTIRARNFAGDGPFTRRCERLFEETLGCPRALLTTSCTDAMEMAGLIFRLQPGDEVILPTFTFVSTANAFALRGAKPIFCDIRADTLNINEKLLPQLLSSRTKGIVVVHYSGVACEMDAIMEFAAQHGLWVLEDNAHGAFGKYRGRWLGTIGHLGALSFHETKNLQCGEGGALLVNLSRLQVDAEVIRDKGTNRGAYQRGKVDKYEWVSLGSSYVMADILAAFLWGQLECREIAARSRRLRWTRYYEVLKPWANSHGIDLPKPPPHCEHTHHIFYLLMTSRAARNQFISHLKKARITAAFHFVPLHDSPMGKATGRATLPCPVAQSISQRLVRLPLCNDMDDEEQERILDSILDAEI